MTTLGELKDILGNLLNFDCTRDCCNCLLSNRVINTSMSLSHKVSNRVSNINWNSPRAHVIVYRSVGQGSYDSER